MKRLLIFLCIFVAFEACKTVPITGRKQFALLPSSQMLSLSLSNYDQFKSENQPLPDTDARVQMIKNVGQRISSAVEEYMRNHNMSDRISEFEWEFNLVEEEVINAWCMPGGKVMFYTGILPVCDGEEGVAVVMGHEVAHAVARHGNERMSQGMIQQFGGMALSVALSEKPAATQNLFLMSYGLGTNLGTLKFSRTHETEADKMGLVFMAMAGYNPDVAVDFWSRMAQGGGQKPPEFLSTHPSDETRIKDIQAYLPQARKYLKK